MTKKNHMLSLKVYPNPEYYTRPLVAMVVTFCMSGGNISSKFLLPFSMAVLLFAEEDHNNLIHYSFRRKITESEYIIQSLLNTIECPRKHHLWCWNFYQPFSCSIWSNLSYFLLGILSTIFSTAGNFSPPQNHKGPQ